MTLALVTELKRLESLASSAPWHIGHLSEAGGIHEDAEIDDAEGCMVATVHWRRDQAFMCHLRNSLPTLLEAVETMHAALEKVVTVDGQEALYPRGPGIAREALARVAALLGEGREK